MHRFISWCCLATVLACAPNVLEDGGGSSSSGVGGGGGVLVGSPNCPSSGGTMIEVPDLEGGSYCIDQTEVTNKAYATWLATDPSQDLRPVDLYGDGDDTGYCSGTNEYPSSALTYEPVFESSPGLPDGPAWPVAPKLDDYPVVNIDWCDAYVFCTNNGKRLCGKLGGGRVEGELDDPRASEFHNAVTRGGRRDLPYGDVYERAACGPNVHLEEIPGPNPTPDLRPVASLASCEGGFDGLFDLVGNVAELIDACVTRVGWGPDCTVAGAGSHPAARGRGGSVDEQQSINWASTDPSVGFRCCADVLPSP